jgi:hypothetical protein
MLGDRSICYCVLDEAGKVLLEQKVGTTPQRHAGSVRKNAAQPDCVGNGNALAVGEPVVERPGARSNRGHARNVRLIGESRKKDDRLDARTLGPFGTNRSAVAGSGCMRGSSTNLRSLVMPYANVALPWPGVRIARRRS